VFVTSELPWPLDSGGRVRSFHLLRSLAEAFDVRLVTGLYEPHRAEDNPLSAFAVSVRAVHLNPRTTLREATRAAAASVLREPYVLYHRHNRRAVRAAIRLELDAGAPDLIYFDHLDSFLFAGEARGIPFVVDLHNIYSLIARRAAEEPERRWLTRKYLAREAVLLARVEATAVRQAAAVFAVSEQERAHFARIRTEGVHVVPNGVDCARYAALPTGRSLPGKRILFIGTLSWAPNVSAAQVLARHVLPAVQRRCPSATLALVGRDPTPEVLALAADPAVAVHANVPDLTPYLAEARCLAVPLQTGGGTRLKILEAFAAGLPVVSTPVGCEGIAARDGRELLVAEIEDFADRLAHLLADESGGASLAARARTLARERYDWTAIGASAAATLLALVDANRRSGNRDDGAAPVVAHDGPQ
jgi:glycosyltransferase involved in cell wall biosynthesis